MGRLSLAQHPDQGGAGGGRAAGGSAHRPIGRCPAGGESGQPELQDRGWGGASGRAVPGPDTEAVAGVLRRDQQRRRHRDRCDRGQRPGLPHRLPGGPPVHECPRQLRGPDRVPAEAGHDDHRDGGRQRGGDRAAVRYLLPTHLRVRPGWCADGAGPAAERRDRDDQPAVGQLDVVDDVAAVDHRHGRWIRSGFWLWRGTVHDEPPHGGDDAAGSVRAARRCAL